MALMTVREAAAALRLSEITIRRMIARGELRATRIGRAVRVHSEELEALVEHTPEK